MKMAAQMACSRRSVVLAIRLRLISTIHLQLSILINLPRCSARSAAAQTVSVRCRGSHGSHVAGAESECLHPVRRAQPTLSPKITIHELRADVKHSASFIFQHL